jgi:D-alanine transaminase
MVDRDGMVTECASSNLWIVDASGQLRTRALGHEILPGCTRGALAALLGDEKLTLDETAFSLDELRGAREVFITSATSFVRPIIAIDGAPVADGAVGPVTRKLFSAFARHAKGDLPNEA